LPVSRPRRPRRRGARLLLTLLALGLVAGIGGGFTYAAFFDTTGTGGNSFGAANDLTPPTIVRSVIQRNGTSYLSGVIAQGSTYFIYAQVTDSGNPASGVNTVTADVSNVTTGGNNVAMNTGGGPWTVEGQSYNYRSALQTAKNPLANGTYGYTLAATDNAGFSASANGNLLVDNNGPAPSDIQIVNGAGTASKPDAGDVITFTFTEQVEPRSILAGWDGTSTAVRVVLANGGCGTNDSVTVQNAGGTLTLPLTGATPACLGRGDYVNGNRTFGSSTMVQSGASIVVTLGGTPLTLTAGGSGTLTWTSNAAVTDIAGNACAVATVNESGALDNDF
jgi:hypothetical protein